MSTLRTASIFWFSIARHSNWPGALHGVLLFDDDPPARVQWRAQTRLIYLDEEDRQRRLDRVFLAGRTRGRGLPAE